MEGASHGGEASEEAGSRWIQDMFGIHQVDLRGDCRWERWRVEPGRTLRFLTEWSDGALTEGGSTAPMVGEEHSKCSNTEKKS